MNVPGAGANGYIIAFNTAEWLKPKVWPSSCVIKDSKSYAVGVVASAAGVANVIVELLVSK